MKWWRSQITIVTTHGPEVIECEIAGPFAVHRSLGTSSAATLTHAATGYRIYQTESIERAKQIAERVKGLDWNFKTAAKTPHTTRLGMKKLSKVLFEIAWGTANEQPTAGPGTPEAK